ncbi:MAG: radical SAM protein [Oscillospiraceae bacterium]|nr:radical SAM protein [Oscillospiraceae bacterium]
MRDSVYKQIREDIVNDAKIQKKPVLAHFELTARCNLDCKMCFVHNQSNAECLKKELTTEQWKRIFDEAYECELLYASLSGGECLLRSDFKELYLHLWSKNIFVTVLTNGTLINDDYVEFFKTYPPDMIQISLYGSSEEGYLRVTGHKGFEKAIAAISSLEAAGIDVRVAVTPSQYMKDDFINTVKLCKEKKFYAVNTEIMLIPNRDDPLKDDYFLTMEEIADLSAQRAELYASLNPVECTPEPCGPMCVAPANGLTCNAGNALATITWDGKMYPCFNAMVGEGASLLEMSYAEAWKKTVEAASQVVHGAECVGCPYDKTCPKCPAFRLKDLHSGHCNPSICELTRKLVAAGVKKLQPID